MWLEFKSFHCISTTTELCEKPGCIDIIQPAALLKDIKLKSENSLKSFLILSHSFGNWGFYPSGREGISVNDYKP